MRLIFRLLPTVTLLFLLSCREDFSLQAPYQDVPVVFAYLDADAPTHYVRVERAVQSGGGDAGAAAADPEQLFYAPDAATVTLTNTALNLTVELERIDGRTVDAIRDDGVFATSPNILYRVSDSEVRLAAGQDAVITVSRPGEPDAVAQTTLVEPLTIIRPTTTARIDDYRRPLLVSWEAGDHAAVFNVRFIFHLREFSTADPSQDRPVDLTYELDARYQPDGEFRSGGQVRFEVDNEGIYQFIGRSLAPAEGVTRRFDSFDVEVAAAGEEVARLLTLENANAGLTSAQALPRYSNVANGEGVVTSRTRSTRTGIALDEASLDSLSNGRYTRALNFR